VFDEINQRRVYRPRRYDMGQLVVAVVGGMLLGGTYALIGLGLVQAFRATGTFNFAHGEIMVFPAFLFASWQVRHQVPEIVGILLALAFGALLGMALFLLVLRRTIGLSHFMGFAATLGVAVVLDGVMQIWFGAGEHPLSLPGVPTGRVTILGAGVSQSALVLGAVANIIAITVAIFMRYTEVGIRIRAAGQDAVLASQGGINVRRLYLGSWALAGTLAAAAGLMYGSTSAVNLSAVGVALAAAPAIVLGGLDSIEGAIIGGIVIGLVQGFTTSYFGAQYVDVITYSILLIVLLIFPTGLFGTTATRRV
jgi:branched-chain amino acid transport system permease protein